MFRIKKTVGFVMCVLLLASLLLGCGGGGTDTPAQTQPQAAQSQTQVSQPSKEPEPEFPEVIKIASIGSVSGVNSESGRQAVKASECVVKYINDNGGIKSMGGAKIELVMIDVTSDPAQAPLALERYFSQGDITAVVGPSQSAMTLSMLPMLQKYEIPAVVSGSANGTITQQGCEWVFQPTAVTKRFSERMVEFLGYLAEQYGTEITDLKVGIIYENSSWGTENAESNRKDLAAAGVTIAVDENYAAGQLVDAAPIVQKLKNAGVDVIFPSCYANDAKLLIEAMRSMDYMPTIVGGGSGFTWPSLLETMGDDVNGICSADGWVWDCQATNNHPEFKKIIQMYEDMNPGDFLTGQGGPAVISFMMFAEILEEIGTTDNYEIRQALRDMSKENSDWFACFVDGNGDFDDNGFNDNGRAIILQWQNNKPTCIFPLEQAASEMWDPLTLKPF